jgi:hypothetical protein
MKYIFDTSSLIKLKHFYPNIFQSVWVGLDKLVKEGYFISTREVWNELDGRDQGVHLNKWLKQNKSIFKIPTRAELLLVSEILKVKHFQNLIGNLHRLKGTPVADPFVIACAKINEGTVVTEEVHKPNAAKIPNVCKKFNIKYMNLHQFMESQNWKF